MLSLFGYFFSVTQILRGESRKCLYSRNGSRDVFSNTKISRTARSVYLTYICIENFHNLRRQLFESDFVIFFTHARFKSRAPATLSLIDTASIKEL